MVRILGPTQRPRLATWLTCCSYDVTRQRSKVAVEGSRRSETRTRSSRELDVSLRGLCSSVKYEVQGHPPERGLGLNRDRVLPSRGTRLLAAWQVSLRICIEIVVMELAALRSPCSGTRGDHEDKIFIECHLYLSVCATVIVSLMAGVESPS